MSSNIYIIRAKEADLFPLLRVYVLPFIAHVRVLCSFLTENKFILYPS